MLRSVDRVGGLSRHRRQEELEPLLHLTALSDSLQSVVVVGPVGLEEATQVQQRARQQVTFDQEEDDQQAPEPAVAVEERVDRLELVMGERGRDERRQVVIVVDESLEVGERCAEIVDGWRHKRRGVRRYCNKTPTFVVVKGLHYKLRASGGPNEVSACG